MVVPVSTSRSRIYNSYWSIHFSFPSSKGCIYVMCWKWYYHFTPLLTLGKRIVILYVPKSTCIVNVSDSSSFSHCITTVYSRVSKENGNWFFWWKVPSTNNIFYLFWVYPLLRMCMYFMIWRLHINLTVYHQYPTLAILAHKHLGIDALLEL